MKRPADNQGNNNIPKKSCPARSKKNAWPTNISRAKKGSKGGAPPTRTFMCSRHIDVQAFLGDAARLHKGLQIHNSLSYLRANIQYRPDFTNIYMGTGMHGSGHTTQCWQLKHSHGMPTCTHTDEHTNASQHRWLAFRM